KAVLHVAKLVLDARDGAHVGVKFAPPEIDIDGVRGHWQKVVDTLTKNLVRLCEARKIAYVNGRGRFVDRRTVEVEGGNRYRFEKCIVATGSSPARPGPLGLKSARVMDSTGALALADVPPRLLVVGGGYIGLELGTVYAALGSKVTVVEMTDGLLPGADRDLVLPLHKRLDGLFAKVLLNTTVTGLQDVKDGVKVSLQGQGLEDQEPVFERVLVAVGRRPNSRDVGLEAAGVAVDDKG